MYICLSKCWLLVLPYSDSPGAMRFLHNEKEGCDTIMDDSEGDGFVVNGR
jgi:hypothetical protein